MRPDHFLGNYTFVRLTIPGRSVYEILPVNVKYANMIFSLIYYMTSI